jgi:hypothetical protein
MLPVWRKLDFCAEADVVVTFPQCGICDDFSQETICTHGVRNIGVIELNDDITIFIE